MIPQFPHFKKLELSDKKDVEAFTSKFPPYSDFNFVSMWSWDTKGDMGLSKLHDNLIVRFTDYLSDEPFYSFLGVTDVNETAEQLLELSKKEGVPAKLQLVPEESIKTLDQSKFYILENRNHFDYVYHMPEFHAGTGKKYETQRNLLNRFDSKYTSITVEQLPIHLVQGKILELSDKWRISKTGKHDEVKLKNEYEAIKRIFDFKDSAITAVCIYHKEDLIAYSISEILDAKHVLCHFAKANTEFSGIYSYLMKQTCECFLSLGNEFLNYEQDLGLPRLRFSKNAFRPKVFLKKYMIIQS